MKVKNVEIEYFVDRLNNQVHVLERGRTNYNNNLPNNIGKEFQKALISQGGLLMDTLDFEWLCYCSNGLILLFKSRGLNLISRTDKRLYKPFLDALEV